MPNDIVVLIISSVTPRKRCVSRNDIESNDSTYERVTPRKRCVSRNGDTVKVCYGENGHTSQEVCE